ncbi:MAG: T9SS type A sorting domain-containing protein [Bacteroidota bacterium]
MKKRLLTILGAILATSLSAQVVHTKVGQTKYSLQSNGAVYNRIVKNADGTISVAWTFSDEDGDTWDDRGTGYNYFNGSAWINPSATAVRQETKRTGFPSLAITTSGAEVITAHDATNNKMTVSRRAVKGTGAWTQADINTALVWNRTAVGGPNGESIHMISHDESTSEGAVLYLRSLDAGATWSTPIEIPGFTIAEFPAQFRGDEYSIAAKGNTVVAIYGGQNTGVYMAKSMDNGTTWVKTAVDPFPIPGYDATDGISDLDNDGVADTLNVNDGTVNVTIDNAGKVHVFWGRMRIFDDELAALASYFPATDGLMYWSEGMTSPIMIAEMQDNNNDGEINFSEYFVPDWGFGMYGSSMSAYPSASVDANNFVYVSYAGVVEADTQVDVDGDMLWMGNSYSGKLLRHVYVTYSGDGGLTWSKPFDTDVNNITYLSGADTEGIYPSLAGLIDNDLHILYQRDTIPGYGVTSTDDPDNADAIHDLVYVKVPKTSLPCNPMTISVLAEKDTCMNSVGILNLTSALGAVAPYSYEWGSVDASNNFISTSVSDVSASGMIAGTYRVAINDSRNCKDTLEFTLENYETPISVSLTQTAQPLDCDELDGAISSSVIGGDLPLSYSWSGVSSTDVSVSGVGIGAYILTISDRNTCVGTGSIILLPITNTAAFTATVVTTAATCQGISSGSAEVSVTPPGLYSYTWTPSGQVTAIATGFAAGTYDVYVTDGVCGTLATFTISEPSTSLTATLTSTNVLCNGGATGTLTANASGGTSPYTFTWNAAAGGSIVFDNSTSTIAGLANGAGYGVSVTDKYNCEVVTPANVIIGTPAALSVSFLSRTVPTGSTLNGKIRVLATGGTPPYAFSWTRTSTLNGPASGNGPSGIMAGAQDITGLTSGSHTITVTDANGCTSQLVYTLTSIEDNTEIVKDLSVYPNPATDNVVIDFNIATPSNVSVKLMGLNGQLVYTKELGQFAGKFSHSVDMSSEAKGVYFIQITTDKDVINKKVIKN